MLLESKKKKIKIKLRYIQFVTPRRLHVTNIYTIFYGTYIVIIVIVVVIIYVYCRSLVVDRCHNNNNIAARSSLPKRRRRNVFEREMHALP